ncbi:MAG: sigma-54-dependent transcriptional regulator, partial [Syntrophobacteraceae bacterium]
METSGKNARQLSILVIEEKPDHRGKLCDFLEAEGHRVMALDKLQDGLAEAGRRCFDLAFIGLRPETQTAKDLTFFKLKSPWMKLVVCASRTSPESAIEEWMQYGVFDYLVKPFTQERTAQLIRKVLEIRALEQKLLSLQQIYAESVPEVVLESSNGEMRRVLSVARQAAQSESAILLRGESGTGKKTLARAIHSWSNRAARPFPTLSCTNFPVELLESELFGRAKGSSAGALPDYPGHISACQGGTLLLDEIGGLPLSVQAKLLRFLQKMTYERVGDPVARKADVRVFATTSSDLEPSVEKGEFRQDLFDWFGLAEIAVPPLRERKEDIPAIAGSFAAFFAKQNHGRAATFTPEACEILKEQHW